MKTYLGLLQKALRMPLSVVLFRIHQVVVLKFYKKFNVWGKISIRSEGHVRQLLDIKGAPCLMFGGVPDVSVEQKLFLKTLSEKVIRSEFEIFGARVPNMESCDFSTDWRFGHRWSKKYFKEYSFYINKEVPYDVKFPWELSRFNYLIPVMAGRVVGVVDAEAIKWVLNVLRRWRSDNKLAFSVNWYPMEASMRAINLVLMLDMARMIASVSHDEHEVNILDELSRLILVMLLEHANYIWVTREYTDVRGNHYAANIVALYLAGRALSSENLGSKKWEQHSESWIDKEILSQFCSDGVNFEKSCGYHKLVLEIFALSVVARLRAGKVIGARVSQRLLAAARYSDALTRPDGLAAGFGDSDDATALPFVLDRPRSHGMVVSLVRALFRDGEGFNTQFDAVDDLAAMFLIGHSEPSVIPAPGAKISYFAEGGYVIVKNHDNGFFLMLDVGEVGMNGRGGHGHNDLLSFEICINGLPIIIDPGCSGYTSDLSKKNVYRSTSSHSTVYILNEEMARFSGYWGICNDAVPENVEVKSTPNGFTVTASHSGYSRLYPGLRITRNLEVDAIRQRIDIVDLVEGNQERVDVGWSFPVGNLEAINEDESTVLIKSDAGSVCLQGDFEFKKISGFFSDGYGQEEVGTVVQCASVGLVGGSRYEFSIRPNVKELEKR